MKRHVKKNDTVRVLSGRDRGKQSRVLKVFPVKGRAILEGVNFVKRHTRANQQKREQGGIVEREGSISMSNLKVICPDCSKGTRVARKHLEDGRNVRICRNCGGILDR